MDDLREELLVGASIAPPSRQGKLMFLSARVAGESLG